MKKFLPFILIGIAIALWVATKGKKAPLTGVAVSAAEAQAIIDNPERAMGSHQAYVEKNPSSNAIMDQIDAHLLRGTASVSDIIRAETELSVYNQYIADGGTKTFEDFMINEWSSMPAVYKDQIMAAKAAGKAYEADEILASYSRPENLKYYITLLSPQNPLRQELEGRVAAGETVLDPMTFPYAAMELPEEPAPTVSAEVTAPEAPTPASAPVAKPATTEPKPEPEPQEQPEAKPQEQPQPVAEPQPEPERFTATSEQLARLASEVSRTSNEYQSSIDTAFAKVESEAKKTGGMVIWTSEGGYETVSADTYIDYT